MSDPSGRAGAIAPVIDIHIHVAARRKPGCRVSDALLRAPAFAYMMVANHVSHGALASDFDGTLSAHVLGALDCAPSVQRGVVLALDAIYTDGGQRREADSGMVVTNEYVRELARSDPKVLVGASVNPNRGEAEGMAELEACLTGDHPAALVKWIPNAQVIDPADPRHDWFYRALAANRVPLLCHTGPEYAVPVPSPASRHQSLGDPTRLERALDLGVTVIAAHCGTRFFPTEPEDHVDTIAAMMRRHPRLWADVSALCVLCRLGVAKRVLDTLPHDRLLLGSDVPIPVNDMPPILADGLSAAEHLEIVGIGSPVEKNWRQLLAMGFPESIGTAPASVLNPSSLKS